MRRSNRSVAERPLVPTAMDATVDWMVDDIAMRCREVTDTLASPSSSAVKLGSAAMLLRGAADDLVSLVELIEGSDPSDALEATTPAFGLTFDSAHNFSAG